MGYDWQKPINEVRADYRASHPFRMLAIGSYILSLPFAVAAIFISDYQLRTGGSTVGLLLFGWLMHAYADFDSRRNDRDYMIRTIMQRGHTRSIARLFGKHY